jgi:hypothetical protein
MTSMLTSTSPTRLCGTGDRNRSGGKKATIEGRHEGRKEGRKEGRMKRRRMKRRRKERKTEGCVRAHTATQLPTRSTYQPKCPVTKKRKRKRQNRGSDLRHMCCSIVLHRRRICAVSTRTHLTTPPFLAVVHARETLLLLLHAPDYHTICMPHARTHARTHLATPLRWSMRESGTH